MDTYGAIWIIYGKSMKINTLNRQGISPLASKCLFFGELDKMQGCQRSQEGCRKQLGFAMIYIWIYCFSWDNVLCSSTLKPNTFSTAILWSQGEGREKRLDELFTEHLRLFWTVCNGQTLSVELTDRLVVDRQ